MLKIYSPFTQGTLITSLAFISFFFFKFFYEHLENFSSFNTSSNMVSLIEIIPTEAPSFWAFKGKDPVVDSWFLMGSPIPVLLILMAYILIVVRGPRLMKNRPPMNLDKCLIVYNSFQIFVAGTLFIKILMYKELFQDGLIYAGCRFSKDTKDPLLLLGTWVYFFSKITELLDTVFFVLRKKNKQITFLHVYHHATMVLYMWSYLKYAAGGDGAILALLNCFVHVVMYTYYLLAGLGPRFQKFLWWKKYVTELQLGQFLLMLCYLTWTYISPRCNFSNTFFGFIITNVTIYLLLFLNFYVNSYKNRKNKAKINQD